MIAVAVFFNGAAGSDSLAKVPSPTTARATAPMLSGEGVGRAENAHRYGAADADYTIVEFSDLECPYCARLHPVLKRVVDESNGSVNWEYRHLPLPSHKNSRAAAIASECVAQYTEPNNFWIFIGTLLSNIGRATPDYLMQEALALGVSKTTYTQCLTDPTIAARVEDDLAKARELGGNGTPFSLVIDNKAKTAQVVSGAVPYEQWLSLLNKDN